MKYFLFFDFLQKNSDIGSKCREKVRGCVALDRIDKNTLDIYGIILYNYSDETEKRCAYTVRRKAGAVGALRYTEIIYVLRLFDIGEASVWADGIVCLAVGMLLGAAAEFAANALLLKGKYTFLISIVLLVLAAGRLLLAFLPVLGHFDALTFSSYAFTAFMGSFAAALVLKFLLA